MIMNMIMMISMMMDEDVHHHDRGQYYEDLPAFQSKLVSKFWPPVPSLDQCFHLCCNDEDDEKFTR